MAYRTNLERLLAPTSVAVVGASAVPEKAGHQVLLALAPFPGDVFPINPKANEILGLKSFPSLRAIGRPIDLVVFAIPATACVDEVRAAVECGCGGGVVVGGGFAEAGATGAALQADLEQLCARSSFRLLGPNTAGFVNKQVGLTACFVAGADRVPQGEIGVVAQSAGVNLTVAFLLAKLGYGVTAAVGLGNAIDVDASDVLDFLSQQPETRAIALHLEGVRHGRRLYDTLREVTRKKPVVVLTVGKEDIREFAQSHTGNLLGSHALRLSALRQAGAVVVESTEELAAAAAVLSLHRLPPKRNPGIGVLTAQAGPALLMLDELKSNRVSVPALMPATIARIASQLPVNTHLKNPVDTGRPGASFPDVLAAIADDAQIDAVITYALDEPAALNPVEVLGKLSRRTSKPILFGTMGPGEEVGRTVEGLRRERIYVAESPEGLARAAIVLAHDAALQARLVLLPRSSANESASPHEARVPPLPNLDIPVVRDEYAAKQLLQTVFVPTPRAIVCATHDEARAALRELTRPVVAKILAEEITHKTDSGGVQVDIADEPALVMALAKLDSIPLTSPRRYLIEEMAPPGLELIVGAVRDASFGPSVMLGLGGIFAEVLRDTAIRLAPLTLDDAHEMLDELRAAPLFDGFRGGAAIDRSALAQTIVHLGDLLCRHDEIGELEINPLRVYSHGVCALDALLIRHVPSAQS